MIDPIQRHDGAHLGQDAQVSWGDPHALDRRVIQVLRPEQVGVHQERGVQNFGRVAGAVTVGLDVVENGLLDRRVGALPCVEQIPLDALPVTQKTTRLTG
jgi:hypothetical protein